MSAFTDRIYASWLASNGSTRSPRRPSGYGGVPPWKRSEADPVSNARRPASEPVAERGLARAPKVPGAP